MGMHKCFSHKALDVCSKGARVIRPPDNPDTVVQTNGLKIPSPGFQRDCPSQQPAAQFILQEAFNGIHGNLTSLCPSLSAAPTQVQLQRQQGTPGTFNDYNFERQADDQN